MTLSTAHSTPGDNGYLLRELGKTQRENARLRQRLRRMEDSRDLWRSRARAWRDKAEIEPWRRRLV